MSLPILATIMVWLGARLAGAVNDVYYAIASWALLAAITASLVLVMRLTDVREESAP